MEQLRMEYDGENRLKKSLRIINKIIKRNPIIELIDEKQYYQTYEDVFGETASGNTDMFNDYGQKYDRQSLRKDFNIKMTRSKVKNYNDKRIN